MKYLTENMNLDAIGVIHAIQRETRGKVVVEVIDGQHRIAALLALEFGDWPLDVKVHLDVDDMAAACKTFLDLNNRAAVSTFDKFIAEVHAKVEEAVSADQIVKKHNLELQRSVSTRDGTICCPAALKNVCKTYGSGVLDSALQIISASWGMTSAALEGQIIAGLSMLLGKANGDLEKDHLVKVLAKSNGGPSGIIGRARAIRDVEKTSTTKSVAQAMVALYNSGRRTHKLEI